MKTNKIKYLTYLLIGIGLCQKGLTKVNNDARGTNVPSLNLDEVDVKDALNLLFKSVDAPYSVDSNVQGKVTLNAENQPFELVLRNILGQANATYKMVDGNYEISTKKLDFQMPANLGNLKVESENSTGKPEPIIRKIRIDFADPQLIWILLNKTNINSDFKLTPERTLISQDVSTGGGFGSTLGGGSSSATRQGFGSFLNK